MAVSWRTLLCLAVAGSTLQARVARGSGGPALSDVDATTTRVVDSAGDAGWSEVEFGPLDLDGGLEGSEVEEQAVTPTADEEEFGPQSGAGEEEDAAVEASEETEAAAATRRDLSLRGLKTTLIGLGMIVFLLVCHAITLRVSRRAERAADAEDLRAFNRGFSFKVLMLFAGTIFLTGLVELIRSVLIFRRGWWDSRSHLPRGYRKGMASLVVLVASFIGFELAVIIGSLRAVQLFALTGAVGLGLFAVAAAVIITGFVEFMRSNSGRAPEGEAALPGMEQPSLLTAEEEERLLERFAMLVSDEDLMQELLAKAEESNDRSTPGEDGAEETADLEEEAGESTSASVAASFEDIRDGILEQMEELQMDMGPDLDEQPAEEGMEPEE